MGVVTPNFSARSACTLLKEPPFLNSWIRPWPQWKRVTGNYTSSNLCSHAFSSQLSLLLNARCGGSVCSICNTICVSASSCRLHSCVVHMCIHFDMTLVCDPYIVGTHGSYGMGQPKNKGIWYSCFHPTVMLLPFISGNEIARSELSHHCSCIFSHPHYFL